MYGIDYYYYLYYYYYYYYYYLVDCVPTKHDMRISQAFLRERNCWWICIWVQEGIGYDIAID